jgi:hypothetical protein
VRVHEYTVCVCDANPQLRRQSSPYSSCILCRARGGARLAVGQSGSHPLPMPTELWCSRDSLNRLAAFPHVGRHWPQQLVATDGLQRARGSRMASSAVGWLP